MSKEMLFFSARKINSNNGYARFFHTKTYLRQKSDLFRSREAIPKVMLASGYKKAAKFSIHRAQWDALRRPIPLGYLGAIDVQMDVLALTAEVDMEEFREALEFPLYPKYGIIRLTAAFFQNITFPDGTTEQEAIARMKNYSRAHHMRCCINFQELKVICIAADGIVTTRFFEPTLRRVGKFLVPSSDGEMIGSSRIGR